MAKPKEANAVAAVPTKELEALLTVLGAHLDATAKDYASTHLTALNRSYETYKAEVAAL